MLGQGPVVCQDLGVIFDVQFSPGRCSWEHYLEAVQTAEVVGFSTVWVLDHFSGRPFGGHTMLECFTTLGAMSAATTTIGLGSLVANVGNRHLGLLASAAASTQIISGGRFTLGIGAGASPTSVFGLEQHVLGIPIPARLAERHQRVIDALDFLAAHWSEPRDERWQGFPQPSPAPSIVVGVNSARLAAIAGSRTAGVNVRASHPDRSEIFDAARCTRNERIANIGAQQAGEWTSSVWTTWDDKLADPDHPLRRELAADGVDRVILCTFEPPDVAAIGRFVVPLRS